MRKQPRLTLADDEVEILLTLIEAYRWDREPLDPGMTETLRSLEDRLIALRP